MVYITRAKNSAAWRELQEAGAAQRPQNYFLAEVSGPVRHGAHVAPPGVRPAPQLTWRALGGVWPRRRPDVRALGAVVAAARSEERARGRARRLAAAARRRRRR